MTYDRLRASRLYHTFLRHRVWAWRTAMKTWALFAIFPLGIVMGVWWVGTTLPTFLATSMLVNLLGLHSASLPLYMMATLAHIIALGPIYTTLFRDSFKDYFAHLSRIFGRPAAARARLRQVEADLSDWRAAHA